MHPRAEAFVAAANDRYGFDPGVTEFDAGTRTAEDAAAAIGCRVAQIASSLVFACEAPRASGESGERSDPRTTGGLVVVVTSGANRVDEDHVAAVHGVDSLEMADAERIKAELGWTIGGVPPICHEATVPVYVDETLGEFDTVWAAAGTPEAVFPIAPDELVELSGATTISVTGAD